MRITHFLAFLSASVVLGAPSSERKADIPTYSNNVIFTPPSTYTDPRVLYARNLELPNGDLLATWENYSPEPPPVYFPIYKSTDKGKTWKELSRVQDYNKRGLRYQPFLYVLPEAIGSFPKGTVLLAGSSIPTDLSTTQIDIYASSDCGVTWNFVSHIANGGKALPNNGETPVWEPFLLALNGKLICYYSDQRDTAYGQKLVHQTTTDLKSWGSVVNDVTHSNYTDRPGMPILAKMPDGNYIYTYEFGSFFGSSSYSFPLYYRIAKDPEKISAAADQRLNVNTGAKPTSSPYIVWSSYGGSKGTLIASSGTSGSIYVNQDLGKGTWKEIKTPEPQSYTRSLRVMEGDPSKLLINGAGHLPPSTTNKVTVTMVDLKALGV